DAGPPRSAYPAGESAPRLGDLQADPSNVERRAGHQSRVSLSRIVSLGGAGADRREVGSVTRRQASEVLRAHAFRSRAIRSGGEELAAVLEGGRAYPSRRGLIDAHHAFGPAGIPAA